MAGDLDWKFLINVKDSYEAELVSGMLSEAGIPVLRKSKGSGAYMEIYMGFASVGFDIYVPAGQYQSALEVVKIVGTAEGVPADSGCSKTSGRGYILRYRRLFKQILIVLILGSFLITGLMWLFIKIRDIL